MQIESIKNTNIVALFSAPLNHQPISEQSLLKLLLEVGDKRVFIDVPELKVLISPDKKRDFAFEAKRVLVNDKNSNAVENPDFINDFIKIANSDLVDKKQIIAYGFNYDTIVAPDKDIEIKDFLSDKIASVLPNIKKVGVNAVFEQNGIEYVLDIRPIEKERKFVAHFNAHFTKQMPELEILKRQIVEQFQEFKNILQKI